MIASATQNQSQSNSSQSQLLDMSLDGGIFLQFKRESLKRPFPFSEQVEDPMNPKKRTKLSKAVSNPQKKFIACKTLQTQSSISSRFNSLPEQLLCFIFSFFTQPEIVDNLMDVSAKWRRVAQTPTLWKFIDLGQFYLMSLPQVNAFLETVFMDSPCPLRGVLSLPKNCSSMTAQSFQKLRRIAPYIRGLHLPPLKKESASGITNVSLEQISMFSQLEELFVPTHVRITDEGIYSLAQNCKTLKRINLDGCTAITSKSFSNLLLNCNLKGISILGSNTECTIENQHIEMLGQHGTNLESLNVRFGSVGLNAIKKFVQQKVSLKSLIIRGWDTLNTEMLQTLISGLPYLQKLVLVGSGSIDLNNCVIESPCLQELLFSRINCANRMVIKCPRIKSIKFEECGEVSMSEKSICMPELKALTFKSCSLLQLDTQKLMVDFPQIETLALVNCGLMPRSVVNIKSPTLKFVTLFVCRHLVDVNLDCDNLLALNLDVLKDVRRIQLKCPSLQDLQFLRIPHIEYPNFKSFAIQSNDISTLNLQRCNMLEVVAIQSLSVNALNMAGCRCIRKLALDCPKLDKLALGSQFLDFTPDFVENLTERCPQVSMLSLLAPRITDTAVSKMCALWPHLQALVLSNCQLLSRLSINAQCLKGIQVTDCENLQVLEMDAPGLTKLFVRNCTKLDDAAIATVLASSPMVKFCEIHNCNVFSPVFQNKSLQEIHINNCSQLVQANVDCPSLSKLVFMNCPEFSLLTFAQDLSTLMDLVICQCAKISDQSFQELSRSRNGKVSSLTIAQCPNLERPNLDFPHLEKLQFIQCANLIQPRIFSNRNISSMIFNNCPGLKFNRTSEVTLSFVDSMSVIGSQRIEHCQLDSPVGLFQMTDANIRSFCVSHMECKQLRITRCDQIQQLGIVAPELQILCVEDCPQLSSIANWHLLKLQTLQSYRCPRLTDSTVMALFKAAPLLRSVVLHAVGITAPVITHKNLQILEIKQSKNLKRLFIDCDKLRMLNVSGVPLLSNEDIALSLGGMPINCANNEDGLSYHQDGLCIELSR